MQSDVTFRCDDGLVMPGVLTTPDGQPDAPRPGLLLIYEAFGMNDEMAKVAEDLADEGWTVLIPDLFARGSKPLCVARCLKTVATGKGPALDDLEAARRYLTALPAVDAERVGVIGFCMGGGFALLSAPRGFNAASVNYGEVPKDAASKLAGACPIVGSYGKRDRTLPNRAKHLEEALSTLGVDHDVKEYPDAGHSFLNRINSGPVFSPIQRFVGFDYHQPSAEDAWRRILDFFDKHLA
jgi:carboxymethylenebutenolidase